MKRKRNKNYTLYWMVGISSILTVPIAAVIITKVMAGNLIKTILIMAVFLVLLVSIMLLYKNIFRVTVQEITQEEKLTELDRLYYVLTDIHKKCYNLSLRKCIEAGIEQIQRFKRRKNVMFQVAGEELGSPEGGALADLVQTVEDALAINTDRLINRIEIFDEQGLPDIMRQNLTYMDDLINKNNNILMEFETLITETSRMGEIKEEKDISKLRDVVNAMQSLRTEREDDIDSLTKKYDNVRN